MPGLFHLDRVPEPEVMDSAEEVEAYSDATTQQYLEKIDRTFVEHLSRLLAKRAEAFNVLDIGCGPGQIPILIAQRWPKATVTGIDAAPHMIEQARQNAKQSGVANVRFEVFRVSRDSANTRLPFSDAIFDVVTCNSVIHHLADPIAAFNEIARVSKPEGAVLIRDLRRPGRLTIAPHVNWFGRHYSGEMRRLYEASVRAAYTVDELASMLQSSKMNEGRSRVFRHGRTHLGIERKALSAQV
jgi:ubiquinone/menaquinone biosynthesis C-methylase UbiE